MSPPPETPWLDALRVGDAEALRPLLTAALRADIVGSVRLEQTAGERFTGGHSTPVWKLFFSASRGDKVKDTQLVCKWIRFPPDRPEWAEWRHATYSNEQAFYTEAAPGLRKKCRLPHMLATERSKTDICFVFEDISVEFLLHPDCLSTPAAHAALRWLAGFHAHFWEADAAGAGFPPGMCASGDYWGLSKRDNEASLQSVASNLLLSQKVFKAHGAWEVVKTLGARLVVGAHALDGHLRRSKGFVRHRTVIHGDFKTANFFLRETKDGSVEAAVLDFEMTGPGLAAVDLAYFLFPDLRMNLLDQEDALLRYYHSALEERLDELGAGSGFPLETLMAHYAAARCDHFRYLLARGWTAVTAGDVAAVLRVEEDLRRFDGGRALSGEEFNAAVAAAFRD